MDILINEYQKGIDNGNALLEQKLKFLRDMVNNLVFGEKYKYSDILGFGLKNITAPDVSNVSSLKPDMSSGLLFFVLCVLTRT